MFENLTAEEILALGCGVVLIIIGLYRILTSGRHGSNFFNWLLVISAGVCIWLWWNGYAEEAYYYIKNVLITPY